VQEKHIYPLLFDLSVDVSTRRQRWPRTPYRGAPPLMLSHRCHHCQHICSQIRTWLHT